MGAPVIWEGCGWALAAMKISPEFDVRARCTYLNPNKGSSDSTPAC